MNSKYIIHWMIINKQINGFIEILHRDLRIILPVLFIFIRKLPSLQRLDSCFPLEFSDNSNTILKFIRKDVRKKANFLNLMSKNTVKELDFIPNYPYGIIFC